MGDRVGFLKVRRVSLGEKRANGSLYTSTWSKRDPRWNFLQTFGTVLSVILGPPGKRLHFVRG